jgi:hypothetical protein
MQVLLALDGIINNEFSASHWFSRDAQHVNLDTPSPTTLMVPKEEEDSWQNSCY